jgi:hypothetical protein
LAPTRPAGNSDSNLRVFGDVAPRRNAGLPFGQAALDPATRRHVRHVATNHGDIFFGGMLQDPNDERARRFAPHSRWAGAARLPPGHAHKKADNAQMLAWRRTPPDPVAWRTGKAPSNKPSESNIFGGPRCVDIFHKPCHEPARWGRRAPAAPPQGSRDTGTTWRIGVAKWDGGTGGAKY